MTKRTLVAICTAAAAGSAFAQTAPPISWSLIGNFDVGLRNVQHDDPTQKRLFFTSGNSATSLLIGIATLDLGGGTKASVLAEIDHNPAASSTSNGALGGQNYNGTPFNGEQFVSLSGAYGTVKFGIPNSWGLITALVAQPFSTGLASAYGGGMNRMGTTGASGINGYVGNGTGRIIRYERSAIYTSPTISGFNAQLEWSPKNDKAADGSASNNNEFLGLGASFNMPGLSAMFFHGQAKAGGARAAGTTPPQGAAVVANALLAGESVKWDMLGANYKVMPDLTLYGGFTSTTTSNDIEKTKSMNVAAKYTIGDIDLMANIAQRGANGGANAAVANKVPKATMLGAGVDYRLSPKVVWYVRFDSVNKVNVLDQKQTLTAAGLRVGF
jgi:predicted porin